MRRFLARSSEVAWLFFAVVALAASLRLTFVGFSMASAARDDRTANTAAEVERPSSAEPAAPASASKTGGPARTTLAVTAGPERAQVYVNGHVVGKTPFFGDVSCKAGEPLRIQIVPEEQELLSFERRCRQGLLRIERPDGEDPLAEPAR